MGLATAVVGRAVESRPSANSVGIQSTAVGGTPMYVVGTAAVFTGEEERGRSRHAGCSGLSSSSLCHVLSSTGTIQWGGGFHGQRRQAQAALATF